MDFFDLITAFTDLTTAVYSDEARVKALKDLGNCVDPNSTHRDDAIRPLLPQTRSDIVEAVLALVGPGHSEEVRNYAADTLFKLCHHERFAECMLIRRSQFDDPFSARHLLLAGSMTLLQRFVDLNEVILRFAPTVPKGYCQDLVCPVVTLIAMIQVIPTLDPTAHPLLLRLFRLLHTICHKRDPGDVDLIKARISEAVAGGLIQKVLLIGIQAQSGPVSLLAHVCELVPASGTLIANYNSGSEVHSLANMMIAKWPSPQVHVDVAKVLLYVLRDGGDLVCARWFHSITLAVPHIVALLDLEDWNSREIAVLVLYEIMQHCDHDNLQVLAASAFRAGLAPRVTSLLRWSLPLKTLGAAVLVLGLSAMPCHTPDLCKPCTTAELVATLTTALPRLRELHIQMQNGRSSSPLDFISSPSLRRDLQRSRSRHKRVLKCLQECIRDIESIALPSQMR